MSIDWAVHTLSYCDLTMFNLSSVGHLGFDSKSIWPYRGLWVTPYSLPKYMVPNLTKNVICRFFAPVTLTLTLTRWPSYTNEHSLEIHRMCKYELPTLSLLKVIVWQTYIHTVYIQTDRHDRDYIPRRFVGGQ